MFAYDVAMSMPPPDVCHRARQTKDARFDGLFFTGVRSTHIFCRPVCPAPTPKPQHIVYFPSAAAATGAGFRACLRCRPELSPGLRPTDARLGRALSLIGEGWLQDASVDALAARVALSPRHLRRLFMDRVGATPLQVHQTQRVMLAKQLLSESTLPVTQVALASGFASVRRFNDAFKSSCGSAPTSVRRRAAVLPAGELLLRLGYRPPFDFSASLIALRSRAIPGVERVSADSYERMAGSAAVPYRVRIVARPDKPELLLSAFGVPPIDIQGLVRRVRRMFDLDADLQSVHTTLRGDAELACCIDQRPGLRLVGAWDGFEAAVTEVLGSMGFGKESACARLDYLVQRWGQRHADAPAGLDRCFPTPACLAQMSLETETGFDSRLAQTIRRLSRAVHDGTLTFGAGQALDDFVARFVALTGAPAACAQAVALRAMGDPDAFPASSVERTGCSVAALCATSSDWRPWRAYALTHFAVSYQPAMPAQEDSDGIVQLTEVNTDESMKHEVRS